MVNGWLVIKIFVFGGNYFARRELVLYINHSGKYIEINFNMKIPFPRFLLPPFPLSEEVPLDL